MATRKKTRRTAALGVIISEIREEIIASWGPEGREESFFLEEAGSTE